MRTLYQAGARKLGGFVACFALLSVFCGHPVQAEPSPPAGTLKQPVGTSIIPDRFLRRWDTVTIFFDQPTGQQPGPEDHPERWVTLAPAHPGAYRWLDQRTLQFRPAEPWPALTRYTWQVLPSPAGRGAGGEGLYPLFTLMEAPQSTQPSPNQDNLEPLDSLTLTFGEPLDPAALARMARIELRPLPGLDASQARWLNAADFTVKTVERQDRADRASYVLQLKETIGPGWKIILHLQLALDEQPSTSSGSGKPFPEPVPELVEGVEGNGGESFKQIVFSTQEPFRITQAGCNWQSYPLTPEGVRYAPEQAMQCSGSERTVRVSFSAEPRQLGTIEARNLVRFTPGVEDLSFSTYSNALHISGRFQPNTLYRVTLLPQPLQDEKGRPLDMRGESELYVYFQPKPDFLKWQANRGIVERFGPQRLPLEGRGFDRVDLRVYPLDPLDRAFWPFPGGPVTVDEAPRPPGPGEEPPPVGETSRVNAQELSRHIKALGSPPVSALVDLPTQKAGNAARFGLDLAPHFARFDKLSDRDKASPSTPSTSSGSSAPGHYLVGIRPLDGSTQRAWIRVQVTDLSLTTVEEPGGVKFAVTSLRSGLPVAGAEVRVEGVASTGSASGARWTTFFTARTDNQGMAAWAAPGNGRDYREVRRIVVSQGDDLLALDPAAPPERYADNHWHNPEMNWLQWAFEPLAGRFSPAEELCHVFTERPVYRPEDRVHIKGYLRTRAGGELGVSRREVKLVVEGPDDLVWRYPLPEPVEGSGEAVGGITEYGSFYHLFDEKTEPTGPYRVYLEEKDGTRCGEMTFLKDAYRIPTFEVKLESPDPVPLDQPFDVKLIASYYAGGMLAKQPVRWRVAQFPYTWTPPVPTDASGAKLEGFLYSSEARFSGQARFDTVPVLERSGETDEGGAAFLGLDPGNEISAQPRTYAIEATVTGKDDQTVTNTRRINAVPALTLGLKVPRYLERAVQVEPELIAVGPDGALKAGEKITLRLFKREWHSHLQVGDFSRIDASTSSARDASTGSAHGAKYITEVADRKLAEHALESGAAPLAQQLALDGAGVYVIELEAHDKLGRAQRVSVDFYVSGDEAQTWSRPPPQKFNATADKASYEPGDTAHIVLESPFQQAQALAVVEAPEGARYQWIDIHNGAATFDLLIQKNFVPRVPVHFILMRGRHGERFDRLSDRNSEVRVDLGKPATVAATSWLKVEPVEHQLKVELNYPAKARPGETVPVTIKLSDRHGQPVSGEVTLWLVDKAVLALGKEQRLDILPDFITPVRSWLGVLDTRNFTLGWLPFEELPGGDAPEPEEWFDKVTVRKRFDPVPYFNPGIILGPDGTVTVQVPLPDDLTVFKIRAKAVSGPDRFGIAVGELQVRLPVLAQPALPRFVRPGDRFEASALARVVEGEGGPARANLQVQGASLEGPSTGSGAERAFQLDPLLAQRLDFPVTIPSPPAPLPVGEGSSPPLPAGEGLGVRADQVTFTLAVERLSDQARDAFQVSLPIRPDRDPVSFRDIRTLQPGESFAFEAVTEAIRPGTLHRELLLSNQPGLIRMASALSYLLEYPYGCTEQRLSKARAALAFKRFQDALQIPSLGEMVSVEHMVKDVLDWLPGVIDERNLASYWPGSSGYVSLTAWVVEFLVEARAAGFSVDGALLDKLSASLKQALRSDYRYFIDGETYSERVMALRALAAAGQADTAYAAELARRAEFLNLESLAQVAYVLGTQQQGAQATLAELDKKLWDGVVLRLHQGREIYGGLQDDCPPRPAGEGPGVRACRNGLILPSETRTVAELARALKSNEADNPRVQVLFDALIRLGQGDGWGSTQANAAATLALAELLSAPSLDKLGNRGFSVAMNYGGQPINVHSDTPLTTLNLGTPQGGEVSLPAGAPGPVAARLSVRYMPVADGSQVAPISKGFVLNREALLVQPDGAPPVRLPLDQPGKILSFKIGDVIEEHLELVNPTDRHYVAVGVPLAAGLEPLNPRLATAPPEAAPAGGLSLEPSYSAYLDDSVTFYYDSLPKGTYHFYFRARATTAGQFIQPAARAEMMYDQAVFGLSAGARVAVQRD